MSGPAESLAGARVVVTGAAGFIGHAVSKALLAAGARVTGIDNLSETYYDPDLKRLRLSDLGKAEGAARFRFVEADLAAGEAAMAAIGEAGPTHIVHLAAHAAVMPSFADPLAYVRANVIGTQVLLEAARAAPSLRHLVYASTSSVYGRSSGDPFEESQATSTPISVYGASKVANEAMMQAYADQYRLAVTGLRFFKVYGPWGRPDTVFFKFVDRIHRGLPVTLFNEGKVSHAFTYIDDAVGGVIGALARPPTPPAVGERHPIYNIGSPVTEPLGRCVDLIEEALGRTAAREFKPLMQGDRSFSIADVSRARAEIGYAPETGVDVGIPRLVAWYQDVCAPQGRSFEGADGR